MLKNIRAKLLFRPYSMQRHTCLEVETKMLCHHVFFMPRRKNIFVTALAAMHWRFSTDVGEEQMINARLLQEDSAAHLEEVSRSSSFPMKRTMLARITGGGALCRWPVVSHSSQLVNNGFRSRNGRDIATVSSNHHF